MTGVRWRTSDVGALAGVGCIGWGLSKVNTVDQSPEDPRDDTTADASPYACQCQEDVTARDPGHLPRPSLGERPEGRTEL